MNDELARFVREALGRGHPRGEVRSRLVEAGWPEDEIEGALAQWAESDFDVPVPRPRPYLSAGEAFLYLVLFSTLYTSAIALGRLAFAFIERGLRDAAAASLLWESSLGAIRWSTASLLIAFPVFFWLSRRSWLAILRDPEKRSSKVREWLTYLTLFVAAGVLIGDLITLVYNLLGGELTARFLLKVAAVGAIAGAVFGFYLWELRRDDDEGAAPPERHLGLRLFAGAVALVVAGAVVAGLLTVGTPAGARARALDAERVEDLRWIAMAVDAHWQREERLPVGLEALRDLRGVGVRNLADPETGKPYAYRATGERTYELCATFTTAGGEEPDRRRRSGEDGFWRHAAGRHCFAVDVVDAP